jgi:hypothetical protein
MEENERAAQAKLNEVAASVPPAWRFAIEMLGRYLHSDHHGGDLSALYGACSTIQKLAFECTHSGRIVSDPAGVIPYQQRIGATLDALIVECLAEVTHEEVKAKGDGVARWLDGMNSVHDSRRQLAEQMQVLAVEREWRDKGRAMTVQQIIEHAELQGGKLSLDGETIVVTPAGMLPPDAKIMIDQRRPEVTAWLEQRAAAAATKEAV